MANINLREYMVRHQVVVKMAGVILVSVLILILMVVPMLGAISRNSQKITTRQRDLDLLQSKVTLLAQLDQAVLADRLRILDNALPPRKDVVAYLSAIDGLSRELGLSFGGISINPGEVTENQEKTPQKKAASGLQSLDTTIKVKGDQVGIYTFLRSIEQTLPLMQIKDVKVSVINEGQYTLSLTLSMLWAPSTSANVSGAVTLFNEKEETYFKTLSTYKSYRADVFDSSSIGIPSERSDLFSQ